MFNYYRFLKENTKEISFGWVLTLLSSFGQTFVISLYVPEIMKHFNLSAGAFGGIYSVCTVVASVLMLAIGHTVDHKPAKLVSRYAVGGLAVSCLLFAFSEWHIVLLFVAVFGLRFLGQGFISHISLTLMSKHYTDNRGKALSLSNLGFSTGEAFIPILIAAILSAYSFQVAALVSAAVLLLYLFRLQFIDLSHFDEDLNTDTKKSAKALVKQYRDIIFDRRFTVIMPASFSLSFIATAIFFYQYVYVDHKGWSAGLYAVFFAVYAGTRFVMTLISGTWVDKFTARKLYSYYLFPTILGIAVLAWYNSVYSALIFLVLAGITIGMSGTIKTAVLAELYGVSELGAIKSLFTMMMVLSTALGPLVCGLLLDASVSFKNIFIGSIFMMLLAQMNTFRKI
ncbi:MAG: MFS transporter [Flavobacteriaceae bacterium]|nr:MFS transporter [Flavobacteriaceae bacterium]